MKYLSRLVTVAVLAITLSACTTAQLELFQQNVAAIEARVADFIAKVKQQYPIILQDAQNTVDLACGIVPTARTTIVNFSQSLSNPSPKVTDALNKAFAAASAAQAACDNYATQKAAGPITLSATVNFGVAIWNAYQAGKDAYQQATIVAASGT